MRESRVRRHRKKKCWSDAMSSGRFPYWCFLAIKQSRLGCGGAHYSEQHLESPTIGSRPSLYTRENQVDAASPELG